MKRRFEKPLTRRPKPSQRERELEVIKDSIDNVALWLIATPEAERAEWWVRIKGLIESRANTISKDEGLSQP